MGYACLIFYKKVFYLMFDYYYVLYEFQIEYVYSNIYFELKCVDCLSFESKLKNIYNLIFFKKIPKKNFELEKIFFFL